jgi:hypothetical protein
VNQGGQQNEYNVVEKSEKGHRLELSNKKLAKKNLLKKRYELQN